MIYHNFYIKAPVAMLEVPLPLSMFANEDGSFKTIKEYVESKTESIERYSNDGFFLKGFGFNFEGLKEIENNLSVFGLEINKDVFILSPVEVYDELSKDIWSVHVDEPIITNSELLTSEAIELHIPEPTVVEDILTPIEPVVVQEEVIVEEPVIPVEEEIVN